MNAGTNQTGVTTTANTASTGSNGVPLAHTYGSGKQFSRKGGKSIGKRMAKRHLNKSGLKRSEPRDGLTKPAIRRLNRRGGIKRISGLIYEEVRGIVEKKMRQLIMDSTTYTEHARRATVMATDVVYACKRNNIIMYGF